MLDFQFHETARVRLIKMQGEDALHMYEGLEGDYRYTDEEGNLVVDWDNGERKSLVPDEDLFEFVDE